MRRPPFRFSRVAAAVALLAALASGCSKKAAAEPLVLESNQLTVNNQTKDDWRDVEVWLNRYFRATVYSIPAHSQYKIPLNAFVSGYAQRFDFSHMQITSLRLTGKQADGAIIAIDKPFSQGGLVDALGGKH